jgi:MFS transporter, DHA2 family, multidrug resistance protein
MAARSSSHSQNPRATIREWIGLTVLVLGAFMYVMDLTVLHLAVPTLSENLHPTSAQLLWIIDIYGFMVSGFLITMGTLGDRIGRRKLLLLGAGAFGILSIVAAFSRSAEMLILSRALLGIAGATLGPSTLSLIFSMFQDAKQRSQAIAVWISAFSAGSAVGPVLGGLLLAHFWWGSVFLLAVPVMLLLLILGPLVLPEYKDSQAGKLDLLSVALSLLAILSLVFGLKQTAQDGFSSLSVGTVVFGLAVGYLFIKRQMTIKDPLIDPKLFRIPEFNAALVVNILSVFVAVGEFLFIAQYLQLVLGLTPFIAGLWSVPSAIAFTVGSNVVPRIAHRIKPAYVIGISLAIAALGLGILTQVAGAGGLAVVVIASVVISLGLAPVFGLTTELIVGSAPAKQAGAASGASETASELGASLGISILGSIGVAIYRSDIVRNLPVTIPHEAAILARDTLGGAVAASRHLSPEAGKELLQVSQQAYVHGMVIVAVSCMVFALFAAVLSYVMLRNTKAAAHE